MPYSQKKKRLCLHGKRVYGHHQRKRRTGERWRLKKKGRITTRIDEKRKGLRGGGEAILRERKKAIKKKEIAA